VPDRSAFARPNGRRLLQLIVPLQLGSDVQALRQQIIADRAAGFMPACVTATAGTVNTGAIDPLLEIADVCEAEHLWFHIDAAIGGPAAILPELAVFYRGIERADSIAVDPTSGCTYQWNAAVRSCATIWQCGTRSRSCRRTSDQTALPWFSEFGIQ
jgi:hypothetical protein